MVGVVVLVVVSVAWCVAVAFFQIDRWFERRRRRHRLLHLLQSWEYYRPVDLVDVVDASRCVSVALFQLGRWFERRRRRRRLLHLLQSWEYYRPVDLVDASR